MQALPPSEWRSECEDFTSPVMFFFPELNASETRHYNFIDVYDFNGHGDNISSPTLVKYVFADDLDEFGDFVDRNFSWWYRKSTATRAFIPWGCPLDGFNQTWGEQRGEQRLILKNWFFFAFLFLALFVLRTIAGSLAFQRNSRNSLHSTTRFSLVGLALKSPTLK
jgi:hypothetical protein